MPYQGEKASKLAHTPIIFNPNIQESIKTYKVAFNNDNTITAISDKLEKIESQDNNLEHIFSVDGSFTDVSVDDRYPSARIGFIQFSMNLVKLYENSPVTVNGIINPIEYNKLMQAHTQAFDIPIYNTTVGSYSNLKDSIRFKVSEHLANLKTYDEMGVSILDSLYEIISDEDFSKSFKCINPLCKSNSEENVEVVFKKKDFNNKYKKCLCEYCNNDLYLIDYLRLHEIVDEEFGATGILSRLSRVIEQLYPVNFIMNLLGSDAGENVKYDALSKIGFMLDGPLAIYGEPAKLHKSIHKYLLKVNESLESRGFEPLIYFGITKTGTIVDHVRAMIDYMKFGDEKIDLPKGQLLMISDDYRFENIMPQTQNSLFGKETYYGQDMVYFNEKSKFYVFNMLYPVEKNTNIFKKSKFDVKIYKQLGKIVNLLEQLEVDLYDMALLPIVLGHKYASISLNPGVSSLQEFGKSILK